MLFFKCLRHVLSTNEIFDLLYEWSLHLHFTLWAIRIYSNAHTELWNAKFIYSTIETIREYVAYRPVGLMWSLHAGICLLLSWGQFPAMAHRRLRAAVFIDTFVVSLHSLTPRCWHQASAVLISTTVVRNSHWVEWYHHSWLLIFCESHHDVNENSTSHVCSILPIVNMFMDITINSLVNGDHTWTTRYAFEFAIEIFTVPSINEL